MTEKEVVVLQHVPNESAGTITDFLKKRQVPVRSIRLDLGEPIRVDLARTRAVCIMGGPMNVYEEARFPFLKHETEFIGELIKSDFPTLGVCLGSQLIAKACGSKVYKAAQAEIGWSDVMLSALARSDKIFSGAGSSTLRVLQWHEDTFDLPDGAFPMASGAAVANQAFRLKNNLYGLQFHIEVDRSTLKDWFKKREDLSAILRGYEEYKMTLARISEKMYEGFFA